MTDTDCKEFKDRKSISILNPVELSTVRMANGPMLMESTTLQPWIKIATDDVIELPTESIIVIADMKEEAIEQYKIFLEEYKNRKEDIENTNSEVLQRISNDLAKPDVVGLSHGSHSSSSGRGHSSFVSGSAASKKSTEKNEQ